MPYAEKSPRMRKLVRSRFFEVVEDRRNRPCVDCGVQYPSYIMQFDHVPERGPKIYQIGSMRNFGMDRLLAELAKCDTVCANCHCTRTYFRQVASEEERK